MTTITVQIFGVDGLAASHAVKMVHVKVKGPAGAGKFRTEDVSITDKIVFNTEFKLQVDAAKIADTPDAAVTIKVKSSKRPFGSLSHGELSIPLRDIATKKKQEKRPLGEGSGTTLSFSIFSDSSLAGSSGAVAANEASGAAVASGEGDPAVGKEPAENGGPEKETATKKRSSLATLSGLSDKMMRSTSMSSAKMERATSKGSLGASRKGSSRMVLALSAEDGTVREVTTVAYNENGVHLYDIIAGTEKTPYTGPVYVPRNIEELNAAVNSACLYAEMTEQHEE